MYVYQLPITNVIIMYYKHELIKIKTKKGEKKYILSVVPFAVSKINSP